MGPLLIASEILAQAQSRATDPCSDPATIINRYVEALGGREAVDHLETRVAEARETEPYTFKPQDTANYNYRFQWKSPDKAVVNYTHVVSMAGLHVPFAKAHFIFDGEQWSDARGRASPNRNRRPPGDFPTTFEAMWRLTADPLLLAHTRDVYTSFVAANDFVAYPERCILKAYRNYGRVDLLYFDPATGLLREWQLDLSGRAHSCYMRFYFDDYRQAGEVMFPFYIYSDFYKATFRYEKVVHNKPLQDSDFEIRK